MEPHLLLDIDGVLCPFGYGFDPNGFMMYEFTHNRRNHKVFASNDNKARLKTLSEYFDLTWATMWEDLANQHKDFFGLEVDLPVIEFNYNLDNFHEVAEDEPNVSYRLDGHSLDPGLMTLKYPYLFQWAKHNQPFAWIDDDIGNDVREWANSRSAPTLLIQTECHVGMTDEHVEQLIDFAVDLQNN